MLFDNKLQTFLGETSLATCILFFKLLPLLSTAIYGGGWRLWTFMMVSNKKTFQEGILVRFSGGWNEFFLKKILKYLKI
jgi:hypothetical protein